MTERTLCYADTISQYIIGEITEDTTGDSINNEVVLSSERQPLVLMLTADEYLQMFSALLCGTDLLYGDVGQQIQWSLWKAAKMENQFCSAMVTCLENTESGVSSAFADWLIQQIQENEEVQQAFDGIGNADGTAVPGATTTMIADCDLDNLFGFCKQTVQMMNQLVTGMFEIIEVITNDVEMLVYINDAAPALGTLASFVTWLQNTLAESYLANYDIDYENDLACELFCFAQDQPGCALNWFNITDLLGARVGTAVTSISIQQMLTYVLSGGWSGDEFCDVSMLLLAFVMQIGGDWTGISFAKIQQIVQSFLNDPDSDWMTLCDCGYVYYYEYDQAYQNNFDPIQGQWATPTALYSTASAPYGITIEQTYGSLFDGLQKVELYTNKNGETPTVVLDLTHSGGTDQLTENVASNGWVVFNLPATRNGVSYIKFHTTTHYGLSVNYNHIRLSGIGDNPPPTPVNPP